MIQLKISNCNLRYAQTENLYYQVLNKINNLRKENINIEKLIEEIYDMNYDKLNLDKETQKKLISTIRIYDLYNISSSEKEKILNDPFNYKNENKNFIEKLKIILEQIKEETSKTLILLDKEYIKFDFTDSPEIKNAKVCDIALAVIDGMGEEYANEFNLKNNYEHIIDKATEAKCKIDNNLIKDVKIVKGNVQIELKLKDNYNKALKFMYYVEV